MPEIDHIEAQRRFKMLPTIVQDAMTEPEAAVRIGEIAERQRLDEYGTSILADEVGWIMLGAKPLDGLASTLEQKLDIGSAAATKIADDARDVIFAPIQGEVAQAYKTFEQENKTADGTEGRKQPNNDGAGAAGNELEQLRAAARSGNVRLRDIIDENEKNNHDER